MAGVGEADLEACPQKEQMRRKIEKRTGWQWMIIIIAAAALGLSEPCRGEPSREALVKAAFVYNFTQFVKWPENALGERGTPFIVAVVGDDPFGGALEKAMANKAVEGHPVAVKYFASADQIQACQLLFVPVPEDGATPAILAKVAGTRVLTVGEGDSFMPSGGGIRLFVEDGRMRFELDPDVLDASNLKASAKLMKLARIYKK
jgi:hypothetical protein